MLSTFHIVIRIDVLSACVLCSSITIWVHVVWLVLIIIVLHVLLLIIVIILVHVLVVLATITVHIVHILLSVWIGGLVLGVWILSSLLRIWILCHILALLSTVEVGSTHSWHNRLLIGKLSLELLFLFRVLNGEAFCHICQILMVHRLINSDAHLLNQDAIGWHAITLLNVDDVADDEIFDANRFSGSISSTINSDLFPINLILETKELPIFTVVAQ